MSACNHNKTRQVPRIPSHTDKIPNNPKLRSICVFASGSIGCGECLGGSAATHHSEHDALNTKCDPIGSKKDTKSVFGGGGHGRNDNDGQQNSTNTTNENRDPARHVTVQECQDCASKSLKHVGDCNDNGQNRKTLEKRLIGMDTKIVSGNASRQPSEVHG